MCSENIIAKNSQTCLPYNMLFIDNQIRHRIPWDEPPRRVSPKLGGAHNENGGFGKISSMSFHRHLARRLHPHFHPPRVEKIAINNNINRKIRPRGCGVLSCVLYDILSQEVPLFYPLTSGVHLAFFVGIAMDMFLLSEHVEGKVRWAMESARFLCVVGMARSPCRFGALSQSCGRNRSDLLRRLRQRN